MSPKLELKLQNSKETGEQFMLIKAYDHVTQQDIFILYHIQHLKIQNITTSFAKNEKITQLSSTLLKWMWEYSPEFSDCKNATLFVPWVDLQRLQHFPYFNLLA